MVSDNFDPVARRLVRLIVATLAVLLPLVWWLGFGVYAGFCVGVLFAVGCLVITEHPTSSSTPEGPT